MIGPWVALVTGLVVFLVNGVYFNRRNILGLRNLKRLYDFPLYWFFQTVELHRYHSGRILRAAWGFFCVILFASYGALVTSNAAAPVERPVISRLEDVLALPEFAIGISPFNSRMVSVLSTAQPGTTFARVWQALLRCNKSDERTFDPDKTHHITKVLQGNYAFLGNVPDWLVPSFVDADSSDVRSLDLLYEQLHMAVPPNAFYKADLERAVRFAAEAGTIHAIIQQWVPPMQNVNKPNGERQTVVRLKRIKPLLTLVTCGVVLAALRVIGNEIVDGLTNQRNTQPRPWKPSILSDVRSVLQRGTSGLWRSAVQLSNDEGLPKFCEAFKANEYLQDLHRSDAMEIFRARARHTLPLLDRARHGWSTTTVCLLCWEREETVQHVLSKCLKLANVRRSE
ncbi:glutamate receptor [Plakobranchus ocellatus]|uniref:Glutamate receptor n=1 Tax=Plakobranchus ocellatus TaxID=259542 RepID=A0AAV4CRG4_9GAST|nr:glutamate receptor [Plakobranchus ocellatus]